MPDRPKIVTRQETTSSNTTENLNKGSKLTFAEMDSNFIELKDGTLGIVGDDSTGIDVGHGDTLKVAGTGGIATSVSGDTLTIDASSITTSTLGDLTAIGSTIVGASNSDITIQPNGAADLVLDSDTITVGSGGESIVIQNSSSSSGNTTIKGGAAKLQLIDYDGTAGGVTARLPQSFTVVGTGTGTARLFSAGSWSLALGTNDGNNAVVSIQTGSMSMYKPIDMNSNGITDLADPGSAQGAATKNYVDTQDANIASDSLVFTNKTFDANGTGNSISNIEVADMAGSAIVTAAEGIASNNNDTTIPTSAAVKAYADSVGGGGSATGLTFVGDDSTGTLISDGETVKITGGTNITTAMSGDTLTITGPDLTSYLTAESNDLTSAVTWANVPDANITQSSVTQHQAALSITESQISDLGAYITDANITIVGDDSTGITFSAKNNDDIKITGTGGITSTVSGNTITIDGSGVSGGGSATGLTFVGDDSTGTLISDGETVKIAGGAGITTAMSGDTLTITSSGSASTGDFAFIGNNMSTSSSNADMELEASGTGSIKLQANGAIDPNAGELEPWTTSDYRVAGATHITDVITGITPGNREYKYDSTLFKTDGGDSSSSSARFRKQTQVMLDLNGSELTNTGSSRGLQIQNAIYTLNSDTVNDAVVGTNGGSVIYSVVGNDGTTNYDGSIAATNTYGLNVQTALVTNNASTTNSVTNGYGVAVDHYQYGPGTQTMTNYTAFDYRGGGNAATNTPYLLKTSDDKVKTRPGALEKFNEWSYNATHSSGSTYTIDWANGNLQTVTLTSNITGFTMTNFPTDSNQSVGVTLYLVQDGTGSRTMTFTAGSGETFKFANGSNSSSVSSANDIQVCYIFSKYDGTNNTFYWTLGPAFS